MTAPARRPPFDWPGAFARLDRADAAIAGALGPTPEQALALLEERARALARVPPAGPEASEILEVARFTLGGERYALETRYVTRVLRLAHFTPVPGSPGFLAGLVNLGGEVLALVDLHAFLGVAGPGLTDLARAVVLGRDRDEFGIMADSVEEVVTIRSVDVLEAPGTIGGGGRPFLRGVTADGWVLLDGGALLDDEGLHVDQGDDGPGPSR